MFLAYILLNSKETNSGLDEKLTMNAAKSALLLGLPALLAGCGGGSGGGGGSAPAPSPITYTWQMVSLDSVAKNTVSSGCSIVAEDTSDPTGDTVIAAYKATDRFNILIHNADGQVVSSHNANVNGQFTINASDVPDNGYVSIEEYTSTLLNSADIYMFAVQKDLLSDMVVNVRQHFGAYECYRGEQFKRIEVNPNAVVNVQQVSPSTSYYQTSYAENAIDGGNTAFAIPVRSMLPASEHVLVTLFDDYTAPQATTLTHYVLLDSSYIYDSTSTPGSNGLPTDENIVSPSLSAVGLSLTGHIEVSANNQLHTWQEIYTNNQSYSVIDGTSPFDGWSFKLTGDAGNAWSANIYAPVDINGTTLSAPTLSSMTGNTSIDSAGCLGDFCLSTSSYNPNDVQMQRTHIRSTTVNGSNSFYQTIFSAPNTDQVLMESDFGAQLNPNSNTDRIEVSLAKLDLSNSDAVEEFMLESIDFQQLISNAPANNFDINGLVSLPSETRLRKVNLLGEELDMFKSGIN